MNSLTVTQFSFLKSFFPFYVDFLIPLSPSRLLLDLAMGNTEISPSRLLLDLAMGNTEMCLNRNNNYLPFAST